MRAPRTWTAFVVALALGIPAAAGAATLITPPLFPAVADSFACQYANVGTKEKNIRVEILNISDGTVVVDSGTIPVAPGTGGVSQAPADTTQYVCRFTVEGKKNFRCGAAIFTGVGSDFVAVPAS